MSKRIERSGFWRRAFQIHKKNLGFSRFVFKKTKKTYKQNIGQLFPTQTVSKTVDKRVKQKRREGMQAHKGVGDLFMNTLLFESF